MTTGVRVLIFNNNNERTTFMLRLYLLDSKRLMNNRCVWSNLRPRRKMTLELSNDLYFGIQAFDRAAQWYNLSRINFFQNYVPSKKLSHVWEEKGCSDSIKYSLL